MKRLSRPISPRARRVLVVHCHPDDESLAAAAKRRILAGLESAGHDVVLLDLYADAFDPRLDAEEWRANRHASEPHGVIAEHVGHLRRADTLVFSYPTWYGAQPAMLKGWFDRVLINGAAYEIVPGRTHVKGRLHNIRRIYVVTSHGSPKWLNAMQGEPGKRVILRGLRSLCHPLTRTRWIALYDVDAGDAAARRAWLDRVEQTLAKV